MKTNKIVVNYNDTPETADGEEPIFTVVSDLTYLARIDMPAIRRRDARKDGILITVAEGEAMIRALQKVIRLKRR